MQHLLGLLFVFGVFGGLTIMIGGRVESFMVAFLVAVGVIMFITAFWWERSTGRKKSLMLRMAWVIPLVAAGAGYYWMQ